MGSKARKYRIITIKRLFLLSCNQCAAPDCNNSLEARDEKTIIAKICHIEAASPDGPRYNPKMTDDERRDYDNLILLCDECHSIIDNKENENIYTVEILKEWKRNHEEKCRQGILGKKTSLLGQAINAIASIDLEEGINNKEATKSFNIVDKINYNSIKKYKYIIEENSKYFGKINSLYGELEKQGSFKKEKLLRIIYTIYLKVKGEYVKGKNNEMEIIQKNADNIFRDVEERLYELIDKNIYPEEDILIALPIIMVDAFMRCKILEEPPNDNR